MDGKRTSVGLDAHARSVVACGLDGVTGELSERRLTPDHAELLSWLRGLPGPVEVAYEAGPTGFGLARFLAEQNVVCRVAAPSRLQRPSGDRVKTDKRDARHLARLVHLDEIVSVTVPSVGQEAARDLVRAREDVRRDLLAARHRLSKLLLRQGIVYYGGKPWTANHDRWLQARRRLAVFDQPRLGLAFDIAYDTVLATLTRRDRLDAAIADRLAAALADKFTVLLYDRRGRGTRGPVDETHSVASDVEDLHAVLAHTGARAVLAHSYGGLVALQGASRLPIDRLAVYDAGVSIDGGFPSAYVEPFAAAADDFPLAMAILSKGLGTVGSFSLLPIPVQRAVAHLFAATAAGRVWRGMVPSAVVEAREVLAHDGPASAYASITADVLLATGGRSPAHFTRAAEALEAVLSRARRIVVPKANHNAINVASPSFVRHFAEFLGAA
ncbi:alpha/beta fold hydrolase [Pseudonocardia sp.]|uniref:alpha/beta fold hydrolase n=1 Tax=Pseudonocardia sp. TaxID=60912 RepID=UPI002637624B|nr:alpha/beta fold hydrolase [Pseudonocardia sp.]MCW2721393.1 putative transposase, TnpA family protein [Pseudonocardia sp.]